MRAPQLFLVWLALGCDALSGRPPVSLDLTHFLHKTVMFIGGHPDDIESHCGGLAVQLSRQETKLVNVVVTNGDKYCDLLSAGSTRCSASITSPEIAAMRVKEASAAAAVTRAELVMLHGYEDGMLYSYPELLVRRNLTQLMRRYQPFAVFTHKPYPDFSLPSFEGWTDVGYHTDHQDTARHVLNVAKNAAGNARTFPDLGEPHSPAELYFWDFGTDSTHYTDISDSDTFERKMDALFAHRSQFSNRSDMEARWSNIAEMVAARLRKDGSKMEAFTRF